MLALLSNSAGVSLVVFTLLGALAGDSIAGPRSSLSDLDIENAEARMTLEKVLEENARLKAEADQLQEKLTLASTTAKQMTQSLALANSEAELLRHQSGELKVRLEAVGVTGGNGAASKLEQRLLSATSDWRLAEQERGKLRDCLKSLSDATQRFLPKASSPDPEARQTLETQVRRAQEVLSASLGASSLAGATLSDGQVINLSEELALVVANLGSKQGVVAGMPFQVFRDNRLVGIIRVVDVREKVAGAIIENLSSEKDRIRIGDRVKVAARQ